MNILLFFACSEPTPDIEATLMASAFEDDPVPEGDGPEFPGPDGEDFEGDLEPLDDPQEPIEFDFGAADCADGNAASLGDSTYPTLQAAIDAATPANPWVWACAGVHQGPFAIDTNFSTGILGDPDGDEVLLMASDASVITASAWRGGLEAEPAHFILRGVTVAGGVAEEGGGVHVTAQSVMIEDVVLREGEAQRGGGLWVGGESQQVTLDGVSFFENVATKGAGAYFEGGEIKQVLSIFESGFFGNEATAAGGAIFQEPGAIEARVYGVYARENSAPVAGAYRFAAAEDVQNQIHVVGGALHGNSSDDGLIGAGGSASVLFEGVDFGEGFDDNSGPDVIDCNQAFSTEASFVHWPAGDMYCEDVQQ